MRNYETNTYNYIDKKTGAHIVKAVTMYAGNRVCASAKCDPDDTFNIELGTEIALKRLDLKIAKKRAADIKDYVKFCQTNLDFIEQQKCRVMKARNKAEAFVLERDAEVAELEKQLADLLASTD